MTHAEIVAAEPKMQRSVEAIDGGVARLGVADQLRQHRIEAHTDLRSLRHTGIDADSGS